MNAPTTQTELSTAHQGAVSMGFGNLQSFELMQRAARLLSASTLVPAQYRQFTEKKTDQGVLALVENPNAIANCVVALNMAQRLNADPLMVMQNLYVIEGRPSWSSQWIIAVINDSGQFSKLKYELTDLGEQEVSYTTAHWQDGPNGRRQKVDREHTVKIRNVQCIAWAIERESGERIEGPPVSMEMAVKEGWFGKSGSKWQTMPDMMLRYRSASFFGRFNAPELMMGLQSVEEVQDTLMQGADGVYEAQAATAPAGKPAVSTPKAKPAAAETKQAAGDTKGAETETNGDKIDQETGEIDRKDPEPAQEAKTEKAEKPSATAATEKRAAPTHEAGAMATDGERKFILNRARNNGLDLADMLEKTGLAGLPDDLAGLSKDGYIALRDLLPKAS